MIVPTEFIVGCSLLLIGVIFTAFPHDKKYLTRLINLEVAEFGLVFIMLGFSETLALVTFVAVNVVTTLIFVRVIEKKESADERRGN
jgi:energy-converting hydrogenase A subunit E